MKVAPGGLGWIPRAGRRGRRGRFFPRRGRQPHGPRCVAVRRSFIAGVGAWVRAHVRLPFCGTVEGSLRNVEWGRAPPENLETKTMYSRGGRSCTKNPESLVRGAENDECRGEARWEPLLKRRVLVPNKRMPSVMFDLGLSQKPQILLHPQGQKGLSQFLFNFYCSYKKSAKRSLIPGHRPPPPASPPLAWRPSRPGGGRGGARAGGGLHQQLHPPHQPRPVTCGFS